MLKEIQNILASFCELSLFVSAKWKRFIFTHSQQNSFVVFVTSERESERDGASLFVITYTVF